MEPAGSYFRSFTYHKNTFKDMSGQLKEALGSVDAFTQTAEITINYFMWEHLNYINNASNLMDQLAGGYRTLLPLPSSTTQI